MKPVLRNTLFMLGALALSIPPALSAPYTGSAAAPAADAAARPAKKAKSKRKHAKADVSPMAQPDSGAVPIGPTPPAATSPGGPGPLQ